MSDLNYWQTQGQQATDTNALDTPSLDDDSTPIPSNDSIVFDSMDEYLPPGNHIVQSRSDAIIVIDQGHGTLITLKDEQVGTAIIIGYNLYQQGADGKPDRSQPTIKYDDLTLLPSYVTTATNPRIWINSAIHSTDNDDAERHLTFEVGVELERILSDAGYTVFKTRNLETDAPTNTERAEFANSHNADYFISIHADGDKWYKTSGSHSEYRQSTDSDYNATQIEFATDIFSQYDVINKTTSPVENSRIHVAVLSPTLNKTPRKTLVEIGFGSNPTEFAYMDSNYAEIALQIAQGLDINVMRHYKVQSSIIQGYYYGGKIHSTKPDPSSNYTPNYQIIYELQDLPIINIG